MFDPSVWKFPSDVPRSVFIHCAGYSGEPLLGGHSSKLQKNVTFVSFPIHLILMKVFKGFRKGTKLDSCVHFDIFPPKPKIYAKTIGIGPGIAVPGGGNRASLVAQQ